MEKENNMRRKLKMKVRRRETKRKSNTFGPVIFHITKYFV